jgi:hypothetical protein
MDHNALLLYNMAQPTPLRRENLVVAIASSTLLGNILSTSHASVRFERSLYLPGLSDTVNMVSAAKDGQ